MRHFAILTVCGLLTFGGLVAGEPVVNKELHAARVDGLRVALMIAEKLESSDSKRFPGIAAWLEDFRKATKSLDPKADPAKWPAFDVDAVVTNNPRFWKLYFEIAPGDPGLALLHAGLLMLGEEASRAQYLLIIAGQRPGIPKEIRNSIRTFGVAAERVFKKPNELVLEGTKLHDAGDYEGALKKYREALALWPKHGFAHYEVGLSQHHLDLTKAGKKPPPPDSVQIDRDPMHSAEVTAAFARARRHDPLQIKAYQGTDKAVIAGFLALARRGMKAWQQLVQAGDEAAPDRLLGDLAAAFQEAGSHDLALTAKAVLAARRQRYLPEDHEFLSTSLKKLAPGDATEQTLKKLASEAITVRQLVQPEAPKGPNQFPGFALKQIVLYVRPQELGQRLGDDVAPFADYMKKVAETAGGAWAGLPKGKGQTMLLIVAIKPGNKAKFWYTFETGGVKPEAVDDLTKKLDKLAVPEVKQPIAAAWQVDLWDGPEKPIGGPPPESLQFPKEWREAAKKKAVTLRIPLDDNDLKLIWP